MTTAQPPLGLFDTDTLLGEEDLAIRDTVRRFVDDKIRPEIADWYESGAVPVRDLAKELGSLGVLGDAPDRLRVRRHQRDGVRPGLHGARGG
jgi:glutaryl-CoA dehydrogenase